MDAPEEEEEALADRPSEIRPKTDWSCAHCGKEGGHNKRRCPNRIVPEKAGPGQCGHCLGTTFRRAKPFCLGCKEPFEPEVIIHPLPSPGSGLGGL